MSRINDLLTIKVGDCVESMKEMESDSVQCCVTSPPYFGLRDYGRDGQIGLEETPNEYVERLVEVFREVRRVLKDDGTIWLNLGDSYASHRDSKCVPNTMGGGQKSMPAKGASNRSAQAFRDMPVKHKDLIGIPWRVAFALQADGWYLRQDIIWHKPNPMPESVKDRCTKSHEYVFLLTKSTRYFFDSEAIKEEAKTAPSVRNKSAEGYQADYPKGERFSPGERVWGADNKKNKRSIWSVPLKPYKGAHFAVFPPDLIEPCILAGSKPGDTVLDPFGGSGTTAGVAIKHDRRAVMCELNPEYADLIPDRIESIFPDVHHYKLPV